MTTVERHGAPAFPTVAGDIQASSHAAIDEAIHTLQAHKNAWVALSAHVRVAIIDELIKDFVAIVPRWIDASLKAKNIAEDSPTASEEWGAGPWTILKNLRQMRQSLVDIESKGQPAIPGPVKTRPNGQVVAQVFPQTVYDRIFFTGIEAEIWMQPGVTEGSLPQTQAVMYKNTHHAGKVALVLGAGNVSSIGPLDIMYKLFVEDQIVIYKTNPVNAYLGPLIEESFRVLIEQGFLRVVYGGAAEGAYLCNHEGVDEIHITGSDKTFDAIVFGTGQEDTARKKERHPLLSKRITGELGNVSPVIVVPGPWKADDLAYHGEHIASMLTNNAGFNCNATRVIIQHSAWSQREELLQEIRQVLGKVPPRAAYYPGAKERQQSFIAEHPSAEQIGNVTNGTLPWTLITDVDAAKDDVCFTTEAFCSLFAETVLDASSIDEYLDRSMDFCNNHLWGTLNATILVHPQSLKDPAVAAALERAIANLRYGTIGINYWAGIGFTLGTTTWGAFPGHELYNIQSGNGVVHNTLMFNKPQKTVLRAPFHAFPTPTWFVTQGKTATKVFQKLVDFEANPSPAKVPAIMWSALLD